MNYSRLPSQMLTEQKVLLSTELWRPIVRVTSLDNNGRHKFLPGWTFHRFSQEIGLKTWMCGYIVYITLRLDDICWYLSWMAKNRNLGRGRIVFFMLLIYLYLLKSLKSLFQNVKFSSSYLAYLWFDCDETTN